MSEDAIKYSNGHLSQIRYVSSQAHSHKFMVSNPNRLSVGLEILGFLSQFFHLPFIISIPYLLFYPKIKNIPLFLTSQIKTVTITWVSHSTFCQHTCSLAILTAFSLSWWRREPFPLQGCSWSPPLQGPQIISFLICFPLDPRHQYLNVMQSLLCNKRTKSLSLQDATSLSIRTALQAPATAPWGQSPSVSPSVWVPAPAGPLLPTAPGFWAPVTLLPPPSPGGGSALCSR